MKMFIVSNGVRTKFELTDDVSMEAIKRCVEILNTGAAPSDILNRKDYIAAKLWSEADVEGCLVECGYKPTEENVAAVLSNCDLRRLEDCTDADWENIYSAIRNKESELTRA